MAAFQGSANGCDIKCRHGCWIIAFGALQSGWGLGPDEVWVAGNCFFSLPSTLRLCQRASQPLTGKLVSSQVRDGN